MLVTVTFSQTLQVEVEEKDTVDQKLEKIREVVKEMLYSNPSNPYLEFIIDNCPECPELEEEMLD